MQLQGYFWILGQYPKRTWLKPDQEDGGNTQPKVTDVPKGKCDFQEL